jgi:hypothetical protein
MELQRQLSMAFWTPIVSDTGIFYGILDAEDEIAEHAVEKKRDTRSTQLIIY